MKYNTGINVRYVCMSLPKKGAGTTRFSEGPLFRRSVVLKVRCSEGSLLRRLVTPKLRFIVPKIRFNIPIKNVLTWKIIVFLWF